MNIINQNLSNVNKISFNQSERLQYSSKKLSNDINLEHKEATAALDAYVSLGSIKEVIGHSKKVSLSEYKKNDNFFNFMQKEAFKWVKNVVVKTVKTENKLVILKNKIDNLKNKVKIKDKTQNKEFFNKLIFKSFTACQKAPFKTDDVILSRHKEKKSALIKGLIRCKSFYCPSCAKILLAEKCKEIKKGIQNHLKIKSNNVYLLTLTFSHKFNDDLKKNIKKLKLAKKEFWQSYEAKILRKQYGLIGHITGFEINYSKFNSYHPHYHILLFTNEKITIREYEIKLQELWLKCLLKVGLTGKADIALTLKGGSKAAEYLTKLACEISGDIKEGKNGSLSLWGLARKGYELKNQSYINRYFLACKAIKETNTRIILWSKGLKDKLNIEDLTEEEVLQKEELKHEDIFNINGLGYDKLVNYKKIFLVKYYLSTDNLTDLEVLLDNMSIEYQDLRIEKKKVYNNILFNRGYYEFKNY